MRDFDDLDDPFDFDGPGGGFEERDPDAPMHRVGPRPASRSVRVLVEGETGVSFDALVLFAEPLFDLYGLDLADAFALKAESADAAPDVVAVLETARLLWAFFALPPAERARRRDPLAAHLVGPEPSEDDWIDIEALLDTAEPYWTAMMPEERAKAETAPSPLLDFDALLAHPAFALGPAHEALTYGPDALGEIEARALFAQPLLSDAEALADPDAFGGAMDRASAYWTLAQTPHEEREEALRSLVASLGGANGKREALEAEARQMVARFEQLFPEHAQAA